MNQIGPASQVIDPQMQQFVTQCHALGWGLLVLILVCVLAPALMSTWQTNKALKNAQKAHAAAKLRW